jgi:hypothetical protein
MRTDGQTETDRQTDMTKPIFAFHHFAKAPVYLGKKELSYSITDLYRPLGLQEVEAPRIS